MPTTFSPASLKITALAVALIGCAPSAFAQKPASDPAAPLRARHLALTEALATSTIQPGLYVESVENERAPRGDVYAVIHHPFATVAAAFSKPANWCESLILHLNVQYCRASFEGDRAILSAAVGEKTNQPLDDTHRIDFIYKLAVSSANFTRVELSSEEGPIGTGNYLIALEVIPLDAKRAFMHIEYSYTQGVMARSAANVYFATRGRDKVGFTWVKDNEGDPPHLVGGLRGALERNTMRYYLAFNAYLHTLATPAPQRFEQSLERWFADTERFARQLREVEHADYMAMKRDQYARQQAAR